MPKVLGALFAVVALAVCILASIHPWTATLRGMAAYVCGHFLGLLWETFTGTPGARELTVEEIQNQLESEQETEIAESDAA